MKPIQKTIAKPPKPTVKPIQKTIVKGNARAGPVLVKRRLSGKTTVAGNARAGELPAKDAVASFADANDLLADDELRIKTWSCYSGTAPAPEAGTTSIRDWTERGKHMVQLRAQGKGVITLSCHHFGVARTRKLIKTMEGMFMKGFTKSQLEKFKSELVRVTPP